jgi:hypothetical protein
VTIRFLKPDENEYVREKINSDPEFRVAGKYLSEDILFGVSDRQCILRLRDGVVKEILLDPTPMDSWSFYVKAPEASWEKLLMPFPPPFYQSFFTAAMREDFEFGGNLEVAYAAYWATLRIVNIMRELQNE